MLHPRQHLLLAAWAAELGSVFTFRILLTRVGALQDFLCQWPLSSCRDCQRAHIGLVMATQHQ